MFHGTLLESQFSSPSLFSSFLCTPFPTSKSDQHSIFAGSFNESESNPAQLRQEACCVAVWPNKALLQVMSPNLSLKSAVSTRRPTSLRERTASTRTSAISRLQVDASERIDTDLGQLTLQQFTQESEVSANPYNSGSFTHLNAAKPMQSNDQPQQQQHGRSSKRFQPGSWIKSRVRRTLF